MLRMLRMLVLLLPQRGYCLLCSTLSIRPLNLPKPSSTLPTLPSFHLLPHSTHQQPAKDSGPKSQPRFPCRTPRAPMRFVVSSPAFALNLQKKGGDGDGETRVRCGDPALPEREGGFPTYLLTLLSPLSLSLSSLSCAPPYLPGWLATYHATLVPTMLLCDLLLYFSYLPEGLRMRSLSALR